MALERLKVGKVIKPLARLRNAHNKLVELIGTMTGRGGLVVKTDFDNISLGMNPQGNAMLSQVIADAMAAGDELHYNDGTIKIDIDGNGVKLTVLTGVQANSYVQLTPTGQFDLYSSTSLLHLLINPADVTYSMSVKTVAVCSGGVTKSMKIIASDPY